MEDLSSAFNSTQLLNDTKLEPAFVQLGVNIFRISCFTLILLLGVPGNSLILRVYWTKTLKTSTHVFIMTLAWADLAVCLIKIVNIPYRVLLMMGHEIPVVIRLFGAFDATAIGTSIMITAVIAVDRYDCVCRPHRRFFTHRWVQGSSSIKDGSQPSTSKVRKEALVASVPTQAARLYGKTVQDQNFCKNSTSAKQAFATDLHTPTSLDTGSGLEANGQRTRPEQPSNVSQLQRKTTKMLFLASVIFSITWLPYWIFIIVSFAVQGGLNIDPILLQVVNETFIMLYINHVVNPFIYGVANRRFRKDCREVIRKFKLC
ncbi:neuromedin-U receptor 2-like [Asterias amurensis]|uniref:neuromedin-U receptor 2-like n=1 Tax=Asterias amurensis TaxID=7602 RepID=UPI003AB6E6CB